jgi:hypothetical protein
MRQGTRHSMSRRRALNNCRQGQHRFGPGAEAGGGVIRRRCIHCGILSIDLTGVAPSRASGFSEERLASMDRVSSEPAG